MDTPHRWLCRAKAPRFCSWTCRSGSSPPWTPTTAKRSCGTSRSWWPRPSDSGCPSSWTEQYAKGPRSHLAGSCATRSPPMSGPWPRSVFSCWAAEEARARLKTLGTRRVILAGIEAHVCVLMTALDLLGADLTVHVAADASPRAPRPLAARHRAAAPGGRRRERHETLMFQPPGPGRLRGLSESWPVSSADAPLFRHRLHRPPRGGLTASFPRRKTGRSPTSSSAPSARAAKATRTGSGVVVTDIGWSTRRWPSSSPPSRWAGRGSTPSRRRSYEGLARRLHARRADLRPVRRRGGKRAALWGMDQEATREAVRSSSRNGFSTASSTRSGKRRS